MSIATTLTGIFMDRLLRHPRGRALVLNNIADAEDNGEAQVFDAALSHVEDPKLKKMIEHHRADEIRHGALFRARRDATGETVPELPDDVKILERLNDALDGFFNEPITDDLGVAEAYLILQVIEERAMEQFSLLEPTMRKYDAVSADLLLEVAKDEERHLKYCKAIVKRYAPNQAYIDRRLDELRLIEARAFLANNAAVSKYMLSQGVLPSRLDHWLWPTVTKFANRTRTLPFTRYARKEQVRAVTWGSTPATA